MNDFITWEMLKDFSQLAMLVWMWVEFTKELVWANKLKTKYYAGISAFVFIIITQIMTMIMANTAILVILRTLGMNLLLYILSAIAITFTTNGMSDFNSSVDKTKKDI